MHELHLVGFTPDHDGLIFSTKKGATSGAYVVGIDDALFAALEEARRVAMAEPDDAAARAAAERVRSLRPTQRSNLSVRDIQSRLRAGLTLAQVAAEAGVDEDWVGRFAAPVLAEQAAVVDRALGFSLATSRKGPSSRPLGDAVRWNLADRGISVDTTPQAAGWTAFQLEPGQWAIRFAYTSRGRAQVAEWEVDVEAGELSARNRLASELGYVEAGARRRKPAEVAPPPPQPAKKATTGRKGTPARTKTARAQAAKATSSKAAVVRAKAAKATAPTPAAGRAGGPSASAPSGRRGASAPPPAAAEPRRRPTPVTPPALPGTARRGSANRPSPTPPRAPEPEKVPARGTARFPAPRPAAGRPSPAAPAQPRLRPVPPPPARPAPPPAPQSRPSRPEGPPPAPRTAMPQEPTLRRVAPPQPRPPVQLTADARAMPATRPGPAPTGPPPPQRAAGPGPEPAPVAAARRAERPPNEAAFAPQPDPPTPEPEPTPSPPRPAPASVRPVGGGDGRPTILIIDADRAGDRRRS